MTRKKEVVRCVVCGVRATKTLYGFNNTPLCDNIVCFHTRIDEVNNEIITAVRGGENVENRII